jgi:hypothetical protein
MLLTSVKILETIQPKDSIMKGNHPKVVTNLYLFLSASHSQPDASKRIPQKPANWDITEGAVSWSRDSLNELEGLLQGLWGSRGSNFHSTFRSQHPKAADESSS